MIKLIHQGTYELLETIRHTRMLILDENNSFAWIHAGTIGEILVASHAPHHTDHVLSAGKYRLYDIKDEPHLTDLVHLELLVGIGIWQGYLLPTGLPSNKKKRNKIIPTKEIITKSIYG